MVLLYTRIDQSNAFTFNFRSITDKKGLHFFSGILDSNGADASQIAAALKKSARKKRGGIIGGSLPSVGLDQDETQEIIIKDEEPSASTISTPGLCPFVFNVWFMSFRQGCRTTN